jgi:hypothetical protein
MAETQYLKEVLMVVPLLRDWRLWRRRMALLAVTIVAASIAAAAESPVAQEVPVEPRLLEGRTLTVPEANFSITAPEEGWSWRHGAASASSELDSGSPFVCVHEASGARLSIVVLSPHVDRMSMDDMAAMKEGFASWFAGAGQVSAFSSEPWSTPLPGSHRIEFDLVQAGTAPRHCLGAVTWTGKVVLLMTCGSDTAPASVLAKFAASFRKLSPDDLAALRAQYFAIHMSRPLAMGDRFVSSGSIQNDARMVAEPGHQANEEHSLVRYDLAVDVGEVTPRGLVSRAAITVRQLVRETGGTSTALLPPGEVVTARRAGSALILEVRGDKVSDEIATAIQHAVSPRRDEAPSDDQAFGTELRRKIGEAWPVHADAIVDLLPDELVVDAKDIEGTTTLTGQRLVGKNPCLELRSHYEVRDGSVTSAAMPGGVRPSLKIATTETRIRPIDPALFAGQDDQEVEISTHLVTKDDAGAPVEVTFVYHEVAHRDFSPLPRRR